jgi:hypothetical protein
MIVVIVLLAFIAVILLCRGYKRHQNEKLAEAFEQGFAEHGKHTQERMAAMRSSRDAFRNLYDNATSTVGKLNRKAAYMDRVDEHVVEWLHGEHTDSEFADAVLTSVTTRWLLEQRYAELDSRVSRVN